MTLLHVVSMEVAIGAVREAREVLTWRLPEVGVVPGTVFADAVQLVVSELVANVVRHAPASPVAEVGVMVGSGQLFIAVADEDPRLPDLSPDAMGGGLRTVAELAAAYDGDISLAPADGRSGKTVLVRLAMP
ncbi:ATP-binding protein [Streptomyces sp. NPDC058045]|uniref:ATP-binding protein n=1 Tax=Streptomyces sp. NPDC058045 TaxID=3346311 RepID=UPI0036F09C71